MEVWFGEIDSIQAAYTGRKVKNRSDCAGRVGCEGVVQASKASAGNHMMGSGLVPPFGMARVVLAQMKDCAAGNKAIG